MKRYRWSAIFVAGMVVGTAGLVQGDDQNPAEVFKSLDVNGDGKLQADEIPEAQRRFFERLLRVGDKNSDGVLSQEEYTSGLTERPQEGSPGVPGRPESGRRPFPGAGGDRPEIGQMFDRMDTNKDGKLTRDELPEFARDRMGRLFEALGKDSLTREELSRAMATFGERGGPDSRSREAGEPRPGGPPEGRGFPGAGPSSGRGPAFLRVLDKNGDMQLSADELEDAAAKLKTLDRNNDGILDMSELVGSPGPGGPGPGFPGAPPFGMRRDGEGPRPEGASRDGERREAERREAEIRDAERREGERREFVPRDGERSPGPGPRDGERPPGPGPRDGERPPFGGGGPAFFRELDTDQNGRLSQEELSKAVSKLDRNNDGELDMAELLGFGGMRGREGGGPPGGPGQGPGPGPGFNPEEMMSRMDRNGDGKVTQDELPERIRDRFAELDKNQDGALAGEELRDALRGMFNRGAGFRERPPGEGRPESDRPRRPQPE